MAGLITSITLDPYALLEAFTPIVHRFNTQKRVLCAHVWMKNSDDLVVNWINRRPINKSWDTFIRVFSVKRVSKFTSEKLVVKISDGLSDLLWDELVEVFDQLGAEVVG